jgi:prepilin-type N-terminal cleavage/methylation domain-containing protein
MKSEKGQFGKQGFTIIELLTVMSIIVILIGLLVPALNRVRRYALTVQQQAQIHSITAALEMFRNDNEQYPDSGRFDDVNQPYCGAMKLAEAMMGVDLLGYHPNSRFRANRTDGAGTIIYEPGVPNLQENLKMRQGTYLQADKASATNIGELYYGPSASIGSFTEYSSVLCDVYAKTRQKQTNEKLGMPLLYYKADTSKALNDYLVPGSSIYDFRDNMDLLQIGKPDSAAFVHRLEKFAGPPAEPTGERFYKNILNRQVTTVDRPVRPDSYILISAGWDGEYGTADDIMNFDWSYIP